MASLAVTRSGTPASANRQIPLFCTVCPETPHFSDVSHLLTHIASKGHLHHETQTRLKSHQDLAAHVVLQQYEHWYKDNGIEALLVDRMKAKQLKEAARNKRIRGTTPTLALKPKRKAKRSANPATIKHEHDDFDNDFPLFPGFFPSENEAENQDEFFVGNDMLPLKGQVWPGMGKLDLANEDMKRTRNQRKPNSVIEKMRKTSEGIEPTQVVMTADFEVERIKGVYDSSSPIPGQEEETPKQVENSRHKRPKVLAEISVNVPRGGNRRSSRNALTNSTKRSQVKPNNEKEASVDTSPSIGEVGHGHDVFRDDDGGSGLYEDRPFARISHRNQKFDLRERLGLHAPAPTSISRSNMLTPTPSSRALPARFLSARESQRARSQYRGQNTHTSLGPFTQPEAQYGLNDVSMYDNSTRLHYSASGHFNTLSQDGFRLDHSNHLQPKLEEYAASNTGDPLSNSSNNQFLTMSESNPLFSQDRLFLSPYSHSNASQHLASLAFTPINRSREQVHAAHHDGDRRPSGVDIKLESHFCEAIEPGQPHDSKQQNFAGNGIWDPQGPEAGIELHDELDNERLEM